MEVEIGSLTDENTWRVRKTATELKNDMAKEKRKALTDKEIGEALDAVYRKQKDTWRDIALGLRSIRVSYDRGDIHGAAGESSYPLDSGRLLTEILDHLVNGYTVTITLKDKE